MIPAALALALERPVAEAAVLGAEGSAPARDGPFTSKDTEASMPAGGPTGARCVRNSSDSRFAIRTAYRTLLRSSSLWEPRYPPLGICLQRLCGCALCKVVCVMGSVRCEMFT